MKNEGNVCFKAGEYEKAVQFYTDAINIVPPDDKQQQATFFQNRAAAHERLVSLIPCFTANECRQIFRVLMFHKLRMA